MGNSSIILTEALARDVGTDLMWLVSKEMTDIENKSEAMVSVYKKYNTLITKGVVDAVLKEALKSLLILCCKEQKGYSSGEYESIMEQAVASKLGITTGRRTLEEATGSVEDLPSDLMG